MHVLKNIRMLNMMLCVSEQPLHAITRNTQLSCSAGGAFFGTIGDTWTKRCSCDTVDSLYTYAKRTALGYSESPGTA